MATQVSICNLALGNIGHTEQIASLSENSKAAKACNRLYGVVRQELLRSYPWNFARKYKVLALLDEDVESYPPGWEYAYEYPSDCLNALAVCDEDGLRAALRVPRFQEIDLFREYQVRYPWEVFIKDGLDGRKIATDLDTARLIYTADVEDPSVYDPLFVKLFAWQLAADLAMPMSVTPALAANAENKVLMYRGMATAMSMNEMRDDVQQESPSVRARME